MDDQERARITALFESVVNEAVQAQSGLNREAVRKLGEVVDGLLSQPAQHGLTSARSVFGVLAVTLGFAMEMHLAEHQETRRSLTDAEVRDLLGLLMLGDVKHLISLWGLRLLREELVR